MDENDYATIVLFQSTRSARSATSVLRRCGFDADVSIHALRKERDADISRIETGRAVSIHALRKERDCRCNAPVPRYTVSIHALRKERDISITMALAQALVSIHALRKERDPYGRMIAFSARSFNPRAPQGARHARVTDIVVWNGFQSTRSARSATLSSSLYARLTAVSIHALRKERDGTQHRS